VNNDNEDINTSSYITVNDNDDNGSDNIIKRIYNNEINNNENNYTIIDDVDGDKHVDIENDNNNNEINDNDEINDNKDGDKISSICSFCCCGRISLIG
jgi:hypothetical protein